jgi:hypothetical protein
MSDGTGAFLVVLFVFVVLFIVLILLWRIVDRVRWREGWRTESSAFIPASEVERPKAAPPSWMLPAGVVAIAVGLLAFCAGAGLEGARGKPGDEPGVRLLGALISGGLNPLFFVGVPLGAYWLYRSGRRASGSTPVKGDDANPQLTHCPDCGRHVSRLAATCPHCGRPLAAEKDE